VPGRFFSPPCLIFCPDQFWLAVSPPFLDFSFPASPSQVWSCFPAPPPFFRNLFFFCHLRKGISFDLFSFCLPSLGIDTRFSVSYFFFFLSELCRNTICPARGEPIEGSWKYSFSSPPKMTVGLTLHHNLLGQLFLSLSPCEVPKLIILRLCPPPRVAWTDPLVPTQLIVSPAVALLPHHLSPTLPLPLYPGCVRCTRAPSIQPQFSFPVSCWRFSVSLFFLHPPTNALPFFPEGRPNACPNPPPHFH